MRHFKRIQRRIRRLSAPAEAPEAPVAEQAAEVLRHWRETGELRTPDGSRQISLAVYRQLVAIEELECQAAQRQAKLHEDCAAELIP